MADILEQIDMFVMQPNLEIVSNNELFSKMANLIIDLDPEQLSDRQLEKTMDIFEDFEAVEEEELEEEVKAKKTSTTKKQYAAQYYNGNKQKMKKKKKELERSLKGKVRSTMAPIMSKGRKTPTGRHKVTYA